MDPITVGLAQFGVDMGLKALFSIGGNGDEQFALKFNANQKLSALEETMRRSQGAQTQVLSSTEARMAGSGFSTESASYQNYLTGMAAEFTKQNDFVKKTVMEQVDFMRASADDSPTGKVRAEVALAQQQKKDFPNGGLY